jgi:hypothetical protein
MSFDLEKLGEAIATALGSVGVPVYPTPPPNMNPPALVVGYPSEIDFSTTSIALDTATVSVICAVGYLAPIGDLSKLLADARAAISADPSLGGAVARATPTRARGIQTAQVGGIDVLIAELVLTVDT